MHTPPGIFLGVETPRGGHNERILSMCRAVKCRVCGKTTWAGCGQHVAMVKSSVPKGDWCGGQHTAEQQATASSGSFFGKLFG